MTNNTTNKPIRILFFLRGTQVPSARFRAYCYFAYLKADERFKITALPSLPATNFYVNIFFKNHKWIAIMLVPLGFLTMLITRCFQALLCPFYDVIFIQRSLFPGRMYPCIEMFMALLDKNIIFDFDDAIFVYHVKNSRERNNFLYKFLEDKDSVKKIIKRSKHIIVGNEFLGNYAQQFNKNITLIPTPVDTRLFSPKNKKPQTSDKTVIIGWIGTSANLSYLESLSDVFKILQKKYHCTLKIVCDPVARELNLANVNYTFKPWEKTNELEDFHSFDIGIMPLDDTEWAKGKCGFKILQYMACAIPVVASPVGVNSEIIKDGKNGFLAKSEKEWIKKLEKLICDPRTRTYLGNQGRETALTEYSIDKTYPLLKEVILKTTSCVRKK